jgi:hypothetical protein
METAEWRQVPYHSRLMDSKIDLTCNYQRDAGGSLASGHTP